MKTCPNCQMTTDGHSECAVCGYDISNVSYGERQTEKYRLNKVFVKFLFKKQKLPLACIAIAVVGTLFTLPSFNVATFGALLFSTLCLLGSLYKNFFIKLNLWKYNEDYAESKQNIIIVIDGVFSILLAALSLFIKYAELIINLK